MIVIGILALLRYFKGIAMTSPTNCVRHLTGHISHPKTVVGPLTGFPETVSGHVSSQRPCQLTEAKLGLPERMLGLPQAVLGLQQQLSGQEVHVRRWGGPEGGQSPVEHRRNQ